MVEENEDYLFQNRNIRYKKNKVYQDAASTRTADSPVIACHDFTLFFMISHENPNNSSISGSGNPTIAMTCAAPEGTLPRRFNYLKTPTWPLKRPLCG